MKMKSMTSHHNLSTFPLKPSFVLALLSLSLFHLFSSRSPISQTLVTQNYIVRFKDYEKSDQHRRYLESRVKLDGWKWIERRNPAMDYATDFGVLAIQKESVIGEIEGLEMVKDVNLDFSYTKRDLLGFVDGEKRPGKMFTSMSFSEAGESYAVAQTSNSSIHWGRQLLGQKSQVTSLFGADVLWSKGFTGHKVKMAIFDTGIRADHPHFRNIKERTNWTNEDTLNDNLGHGTFVAGVIAGQDAECLGFAPDAEIYAFRVFTDAQNGPRASPTKLGQSPTLLDLDWAECRLNLSLASLKEDMKRCAALFTSSSRGQCNVTVHVNGRPQRELQQLMPMGRRRRGGSSCGGGVGDGGLWWVAAMLEGAAVERERAVE